MSGTDKEPTAEAADTSASANGEEPNIRDLSFGKMVAYGVGGSTIFFALIDILQHPIAVVSFLLAGLSCFPSVRAQAEHKLRFSVVGWRALLVYLAFILVGGVVETII